MQISFCLKAFQPIKSLGSCYHMVLLYFDSWASFWFRDRKHTQTYIQNISTLLVHKFICKRWQMSSGPFGPMFGTKHVHFLNWNKTMNHISFSLYLLARDRCQFWLNDFLKRRRPVFPHCSVIIDQLLILDLAGFVVWPLCDLVTIQMCKTKLLQVEYI